MPRGNKRRTDGRVDVTVYIGLDENGRRRYKHFYGATHKEAEAKADEFRIKIGRGIDVDAVGDTVGVWINRWLLSVKSTISFKTYAAYVGFAKYIDEAIGQMPMDKVRPYDVQRILVDLAERNPHTGRPSSQKLLADVRAVARRMFTYAIGNRVLDHNPADYTAVPKAEPAHQRRALTDEERGWIETTEHRMQLPAMILLYTGLRRGELLPLVRSDFDLDNCTLRVEKFVEMVGGHPQLKRYGKTHYAAREVHFPQLLADFLRPRLSALAPVELVCPMSPGKMYTDSGWRAAWRSYLSVLNFEHGTFLTRPDSRFDPQGVPMVIEPFTAHCLRHTFATMMFTAGVDVLTARDQLGHSDIKTTLGIYTHLQTEKRDRSMTKLNDFLDGKTMLVKCSSEDQREASDIKA